MLKMPPRNDMTLNKDEKEFFAESCEYNQALGWNKALEEVTRLNADYEKDVQGLVRACEAVKKSYDLGIGLNMNVVESALQPFREEE